jgi:hypothetical protein
MEELRSSEAKDRGAKKNSRRAQRKIEPGGYADFSVRRLAEKFEQVKKISEDDKRRWAYALDTGSPIMIFMFGLLSWKC